MVATNPVAILILGVLLFASGVENFAFLPSSSITSTTSTADYHCDHSVQQHRHLVEQQLGYLPSNFVRVAAFAQDGSPLVVQTYPLAGGSPRRQARSAMGSSKKNLRRNKQQQQQQQQQHSNQQQEHSPKQQTPFPTLYWLCHPQVNKRVAELERHGCVAEFQKIIDNNEQLRNEWFQSHQQYARERWKSLTLEDQRWLLSAADDDDPPDSGHPSWAAPSKLAILRDSGISGSNLTTGAPPSVKCLHAHFAHYRASLLADEEARHPLTTTRLRNPVGAMVHERLRVEFPDLVL